MTKILAIDTAIDVCSVSLIQSDSKLYTIEGDKKATHSSTLFTSIEKILKQTNTAYAELNAIAVSSGPGSYTGLRIGVSASKGICYALQIPLIAIDTLLAMALAMKSLHPIGENDLLQPMIDARRMEVYTAVYNSNLNTIIPPAAVIIDETSFSHLPLNGKLFTGGNGAFKCQVYTDEVDAIISIDSLVHTSATVAKLALQKYANNEFEDVAYFEPFYLKSYIPGKPKVKGLNS